MGLHTRMGATLAAILLAACAGKDSKTGGDQPGNLANEGGSGGRSGAAGAQNNVGAGAFGAGSGGVVTSAGAAGAESVAAGTDGKGGASTRGGMGGGGSESVARGGGGGVLALAGAGGEAGSGGDSATSAGAGGAQGMPCNGKLKGYLRDFTIGDAMGKVILPGTTTPVLLAPDGSTAWWTGPSSVAPTAETVNGVAYQVSPDFEIVTHAGAAKQYNVDDKAIVQPNLGSDQTPIYAGPANGTATTTGPANFATWFHDTAGVNVGQVLELQFVKNPNQPGDPNAYTFSTGATGTACSAADQTYCFGFYPIDGQLLGNEGNTHNYHMTFELHLKFKYHSGQIFSFTGDDDVWTYVNGQLAINLGGLHQAETQMVDLDTLGLVEGTTYPLDFFWCERHITAANFHVDTSVEIVDCGTLPGH